MDLLVLAPDRRTVVVVEVKSGVPPIGTTSKREQVPEAHVTGPKQRRLVALACQIARRYRLTRRPIRFDVVGVDLLLDGPPVVRHHVGAFQSHV